MQLYKAKLDGVIFKKSKYPTVKSVDEFAHFIKKDELILVTNVESLTDKDLSFPYKKYTLWNDNYAISVAIPSINDEEPYVKGTFADVPKHLLIQIQKPKVYITLGVLLVGLATYSIIKERKNS